MKKGRGKEGAGSSWEWLGSEEVGVGRSRETFGSRMRGARRAGAAEGCCERVSRDLRQVYSLEL